MIDLIELKNIDAIGNLIARRARQFQDEREWEDYLASQGIGIEIDHAFVGLKRPPETPERKER